MTPLIGEKVLRLEDEPLLTGKARFVDDIDLPEAQHVAFVRSEHAHALIRGIELAAARSLPGVTAILTLDDLMPVLVGGRMPRGAKRADPSDVATPYLLARGETAFAGEAIAMVVAQSRYLAEDAASLIAVDYQALP